jgi:diguanylate cyclase (GGDEF)-like protein
MDTAQRADAAADAKARKFEAARNAFALKMAALHDLSLDLSLADDVDDLCRRAVGLGHRILGFDRIGIWFIDPLDSALLYGSYGTDETGLIRDERGVAYRRSEETLPAGFYEGREPVYYMGVGPCFNERHEVVGSAEKALALVWDGRKVIGEIWVDNLMTQRAIDGGSLELLVRFARIVGYLTSLKRVQAELRQLSAMDELTGVVNRRTVLVILEKQFSLTIRRGGNLSIVFCDLDDLKGVNDRHGHSIGDDYIKTACSALASAIRDSDTVGRFGDDEFLIVLPDCDAEGAALIDARIEAAVAAINGGASPKAYPVSISRGLANLGELEAAGMEKKPQALIELADARMFEAKGRRRKAPLPPLTGAE